MEEIKIVNRWDESKIIISGKYESIKDCLERSRGADLRGAKYSILGLYRIRWMEREI